MNNFKLIVSIPHLRLSTKLSIHAFSASTQVSFLFIFQLLVTFPISTNDFIAHDRKTSNPEYTGTHTNKIRKTDRKVCSIEKPYELIFGTLIVLYRFKHSN